MDQCNVIGKDARSIIPHGPNRVLVDVGGSAVPPSIARERYMTRPDVIFFRDDGWTLGAPRELEDVARSLWEGNWVGVVRLPSYVIQPIE